MTEFNVKDAVPFWARLWTTLWRRWIFSSCPDGGLQSEATLPPVFSGKRDTQAPQLGINELIKTAVSERLNIPVWSYLMNHQGLDLPFEDLHASGRDDGSHVWDDALAEDLADQTVVSLETSRGQVLYRKPVVVIWRQETHLSCCRTRLWAFQKAKQKRLQQKTSVNNTNRITQTCMKTA